MHPFGGPSTCPRCNKMVYAAEQVMGPGRKLYHKPCLACMICNKRLDSYTLLEHDQQPYCKSCHVKNFGTHNLRQANLPHQERASSTPLPGPSSPVRDGFDSMTRGTSAGLASSRAVESSNRLNPTSTISEEDEEEEDPVIQSPTSASFPSIQHLPFKDDSSIVTNSTRIPSPTRMGGYSHGYSKSMGTLGRSNSSITAAPSRNFPPLVSTATGTMMGGTTGTRYGTALTGQPTGRSSARTWGSGTPNCGRCGKSVFFAEQIKAVGKTFHKSCLKCTECNTSLDSTKLTEKDGDPLCRRCYGKLHGPQGSGYALLGKAGG